MIMASIQGRCGYRFFLFSSHWLT